MLFVITSFCSILSFILFLLGFIFAMQNTPVSLNLLALLFGILGFLGALGIKGKARVFYHEFKHKIVSGLVGNKPKRLEIKSDNEGEFEFEYTTETKKYNPFIALAPYFFPFVTLFTVPFWTFFVGVESFIKEAILVFALAFDLTFNTSEISISQEDIHMVPGGVFCAIPFLLSLNGIQLIHCVSVILGGFRFLHSATVDAIIHFSTRLLEYM